MEIEFDPKKNEVNLRKHGCELSLALELNWEKASVWVDTRTDYGEPREIAILPIGERLYCVVFVIRGEVRRIISLRKANEREVRNYVNQLDNN